jgi:hypothetical protein
MDADKLSIESLTAMTSFYIAIIFSITSKASSSESISVNSISSIIAVDEMIKILIVPT